MQIQQIISKNVFYNGCETHYAYRSHFDPLEYPQIHDFYEIILLVSGKMSVSINAHTLELKKGDMVLVRPGDVHSKIANGPSQHINLAFPAYTVEALFLFLYDSPDELKSLEEEKFIPVCSLNGLDTVMMQNRLSYLNLLPSSSIKRKNTYLRTVLTDILSSYFMKELEKNKKDSSELVLPTWLNEVLDGLTDVNNLERGMEYLVEQSNRTPEHICRAFRKYLNMTPTTYINAKRLNYAANLLQHSDKEIVDIAFESGFQSVSHFYHMFKKQYQISPLKYKNMHFILHNI